MREREAILNSLLVEAEGDDTQIAVLKELLADFKKLHQELIDSEVVKIKKDDSEETKEEPKEESKEEAKEEPKAEEAPASTPAAEHESVVFPKE